MRAVFAFVLATIGTGFPAATAQQEAPGTARPAEFGAIDFARDFEAARAAARTRSLPTLLLFQEVPG